MEKILISGTGRSGTTFLILLFTLLGLDTGFDKDTFKNFIFESCNSGMESSMLSKHKYLKNTLFYKKEILEEIISIGINIKLMIIPVRNFEDSAKSRAKYGNNPGGFNFYNVNSESTQLEDYKNSITKFLETIVKHDIPTLFIDFEKMIKSPEYLFNKLNIVFEYENALIPFDLFLKNYELASNITKPQRKLLVVSHGGSATTNFMEFIGKYIPTNSSRDLDELKHTIPSKITEYNPSHIIYIYGDMDKTMRSLFRRKAGEITIASIHEYKLKGIKHSANLPANFEDFEAYTKIVIKENKEPVGCLIHMREWKKVPNIFFIHYEQISTSDTIDEYLGIPKGTCSQFTVKERESKIQECETPEYLETMKGLDLRVQGIITGQPHKSNILIVSFPRSGFHLLQTIFESYFSIKECACQKNCDVKIIKCVKEDIAFHRAHDMDLKLEKERFNKTIILYRKDIVEQLDAFFRFQYKNIDLEKNAGNISFIHSLCDELAISYSEKLDFFKIVLKQYKDWVQKWINEPTPNSIIIEYSDFMKNPQETLDKVQEHLLGTKDSDLSTKIVEEMKIEYKHSLTLEKYKELANLLAQLN